MIKPSRKMYKVMKSLVNTENDELFISYEDNTISLVQTSDNPILLKPFPNNDPSPRGTIQSLADDGYITLSPDYGFNYCNLTYKAFHKNKIHFENIKIFLFTSILVPIIVAFVTALLTIGISTIL